MGPQGVRRHRRRRPRALPAAHGCGRGCDPGRRRRLVDVVAGQARRRRRRRGCRQRSERSAVGRCSPHRPGERSVRCAAHAARDGRPGRSGGRDPGVRGSRQLAAVQRRRPRRRPEGHLRRRRRPPGPSRRRGVMVRAGPAARRRQDGLDHAHPRAGHGQRAALPGLLRAAVTRRDRRHRPTGGHRRHLLDAVLPVAVDAQLVVGVVRAGQPALVVHPLVPRFGTDVRGTHLRAGTPGPDGRHPAARRDLDGAGGRVHRRRPPGVDGRGELPGHRPGRVGEHRPPNDEGCLPRPLRSVAARRRSQQER